MRKKEYVVKVRRRNGRLKRCVLKALKLPFHRIFIKNLSYNYHKVVRLFKVMKISRSQLQTTQLNARLTMIHFQHYGRQTKLSLILL